MRSRKATTASEPLEAVEVARVFEHLVCLVEDAPIGFQLTDRTDDTILRVRGIRG